MTACHSHAELQAELHADQQTAQHEPHRHIGLEAQA